MDSGCMGRQLKQTQPPKANLCCAPPAHFLCVYIQPHGQTQDISLSGDTFHMYILLAFLSHFLWCDMFFF